ncbi:hypothetical protein CRU87_09315 [Aliarcobacter trophiarum LMG 25534]|uniref:TnsE C-terminal domain-containing protein n=1 Tax=Aliarcobacter trophiarum LMG 25534 TaxID=1032241 RepID=A0AAD0VNP6_9BACT|nr:hypothetical protein [Aliarcobacter trophiarum]AXK49696.1 hypothetical protein ATR_1882 [Aliarcobacter trophiarum LMG 25534]RXI25746.1 hypothetical protein CRU89_07355 [Aliarcobacter trophiarum]RXJ89377.1 hypothetical protein CRU87_09315 [Aliarcobacter trophiarum LMG 25534]
MAKKRSIIPEFMKDNPNDTFQFLLPLRIALDEESFGNSYYEVVVKNMSKNQIFTYRVSPELLFTHYPLCKSFKNGEKTEKYLNKDIVDKNFKINTKFINKNNEKKLKDILEQESIGTLLGWNYKLLKDAKNINCYLVEQDDIKIIIPHFTIGIYYYFRFSQLREAVLDSTLNELYIMCEDDRANAKIVLPTYRTDEDAAFIHRFACQKNAIKEFDNVSGYIHNYLKFMQENNFDDDMYKMHLKFNFPTKEEFQIDTRSSLVTNKETNEKYYFIHEITNDYSDIGFDKLTKIIEKNKVILNLGNLENLPKVEKDIPNETSEVLKITHASKRNTQTYHQKDRKKSCGSLNNIPVDEESSSRDILEDLLKIYKEQQTDDITDQSLTESSSKGNKTIRKVVISSEFLKQSSSKPLTEIDNFVVFNQYINFLQQRTDIKDFHLNGKKDLPQYTLKDDETKINPKCKIKKRPRQYLTATFKYENSYVGLLELENNTYSACSTWVIISNSQIQNSNFDFFINLYLKEDSGIDNMLKRYSQTNPKFTKKNHERNENLNEIQLANWYAGLLNKII